ncbi:AI-2E family transporter [Altererythrobacter aquiaggeris]|uniref:AI-2E family transporter n=1 Tax=Aestuarierythrobacter aquiaggeris TaxID=1898396 RepID=UPI003019D190
MTTTSEQGGAKAPGKPAPDKDEIEAIGNSPTRFRNPELRREAWKAIVWVSVVGGVALAVYLAQSLLVIFGAIVFASMIDGGARLLGRALNIGRGWRVAIVMALAVAFMVWLTIFAGSQISREAAEFPRIVTEQIQVLLSWAESQGFAVDQKELSTLSGNLMSGVGTITRAIGGLFGGLTTLVLIAIIGVYLAVEPNLYERGVAWMLPSAHRENFYHTVSNMGFAMRRLLFGRIIGMVIEGLFTWMMLALWGVPMAALLGLLTGLLAFIPNIGALISGALMVLVGFSGGVDMGIYTIFVYFFVQTIDGYLLVPMIARKAVDLAPALVLAAQLILGVLFGILGLALADPLMAMIKTGLESRADRLDEDAAEN